LKLDWLSRLTVGEVNSSSEVDVTSLRSLSRGIFSLPTSTCSFELFSGISNYPAVFFSHNKPANSTFNHNKPAKRTGYSFVKGESGSWHKNHQIQFMKSPILVPLFYPCIFFHFVERNFYSGLYESLHTTNLLVLRI
jgi:hypothetical protein